MHAWGLGASCEHMIAESINVLFFDVKMEFAVLA